MIIPPLLPPPRCSYRHAEQQVVDAEEQQARAGLDQSDGEIFSTEGEGDGGGDGGSLTCAAPAEPLLEGEIRAARPSPLRDITTGEKHDIDVRGISISNVSAAVDIGINEPKGERLEGQAGGQQLQTTNGGGGSSGASGGINGNEQQDQKYMPAAEVGGSDDERGSVNLMSILLLPTPPPLRKEGKAQESGLASAPSSARQSSSDSDDWASCPPSPVMAGMAEDGQGRRRANSCPGAGEGHRAELTVASLVSILLPMREAAGGLDNTPKNGSVEGRRRRHVAAGGAKLETTSSDDDEKVLSDDGGGGGVGAGGAGDSAGDSAGDDGDDGAGLAREQPMQLEANADNELGIWQGQVEDEEDVVVRSVGQKGREQEDDPDAGHSSREGDGGAVGGDAHTAAAASAEADAANTADVAAAAAAEAAAAAVIVAEEAASTLRTELQAVKVSSSDIDGGHTRRLFFLDVFCVWIMVLANVLTPWHNASRKRMIPGAKIPCDARSPCNPYTYWKKLHVCSCLAQIREKREFHIN